MVLRIIERFFCMFMEGEKFNNIISMCLVDYANYLHDKKHIEKSLIYYKRAKNLNPNNHYAYGGIAAAQVEKGLFKEALDMCNKAISIKPGVLLFILQSVIYKSLGEIVLAEMAKQKTLEFFKDSLAAYTQLAHTYFKFNMYEEAEYYYKKALKENPNNVILRFHLGEIYSAKQEYKMAKKEFQKVLESINNKRYKRYAKKEIKRIERKETGQTFKQHF